MNKNLIEGPKMLLSGKIASWEVVNKDGSIENACYTPHKNMILNCGLDLWGGSGYGIDFFDGCCIGTGTNEPLETDTILGHCTNYTSTYIGWDYTAYNKYVTSANGADPYYLEIHKGYQTPIGTLNGTYTEMGIVTNRNNNASTPPSQLFSKFLFRNTEGTPVAVPVTSDKQLRVRYILTIQYTPTTPTHFTTTIDGIEGEFGYTACWQNVLCDDNRPLNYWKLPFCSISGGNHSALFTTSFTFSPIGVAPSNSGYGIVIPSSTYVNGTHYTKRTISLGTEQFNQSNIAIQLRNGRNTSDGSYGLTYWAAVFDNPIVKANTHRLILYVKFSWGRA